MACPLAPWWCPMDPSSLSSHSDVARSMTLLDPFALPGLHTATALPVLLWLLWLLWEARSCTAINSGGSHAGDETSMRPKLRYEPSPGLTCRLVLSCPALPCHRIASHHQPVLVEGWVPPDDDDITRMGHGMRSARSLLSPPTSLSRPLPPEPYLVPGVVDVHITNRPFAPGRHQGCPVAALFAPCGFLVTITQRLDDPR
ncbi:hypothetical protein B0T11DRAFT_272173 [Plectosphaerella cucumerina]|uniref:Uncharacterized protein n=1 Tax=Plectosphaerella cucumerina TaxID=40658 RepID=A0A8K0TVV4_9PEZI|nr:hypothetical protein B0T11DRAFT_272173 [Plectosphaerella cucumerina]